MNLKGKNGYSICYKESIPTGAEIIIVAMHGFAGDKESSCISRLEQVVTRKGIGLVKFDWPAHGESETNGFHLTIDNCLSDLETVIAHVKEEHPTSRLLAFATSFGGYLTLLYHDIHPDTFEYIILRSPAIQMGHVISAAILTEAEKKELSEKGFVRVGYERIMEVTSDFVADLQTHDILKIYQNRKCENISIIHGTADDLVPFINSEEFAKEHCCKLFPVDGADHRYKKEGELDKVISLTMEILDGILN